MPMLLRSLIACAAILALLTTLPKANAGELALGLWTHHFDRVLPANKCGNEKHNLLAYTTDDGYSVGMYKNSHCLQSYAIGYQDSVEVVRSTYVGYAINAVSGYPEDMRWLGPLVVIPTLTITHFYKGVGVRWIHVPKILDGVGFVYRF